MAEKRDRYSLLLSVAEALVKAGDYSVGWADEALAQTAPVGTRLTEFKPEADSCLRLGFANNRRYRLTDLSQIWVMIDGSIELSVMARPDAEPVKAVRLVAMRDDDGYETTLARELDRIGLTPSGGRVLTFLPPGQLTDQALSSQLAGQVVSHVAHLQSGTARLYFQDGTWINIAPHHDHLLSSVLLEPFNA